MLKTSECRNHPQKTCRMPITMLNVPHSFLCANGNFYQVGFTQCWSPERLHLVWMARSSGESITVPFNGMIPKPADVSKRSFCMNDSPCRR
ncbi:hypothetical protein PsorP6_004206 [Peronosclerospora sorghi]|uniref:Uncharacterized protein n=1 Tax=Peronosclerospora sorghi TaxID=230839 RepID=A0ACC0VSG4_9STRA|nr:hypothetical protein PsorP6_004206 [Peronosclerospora sorghi]